MADEDVEVIAEISLSRNESGGFVLFAALEVTVIGVDQKKAKELVESAHKICPYSNAIRGNVEWPSRFWLINRKASNENHQKHDTDLNPVRRTVGEKWHGAIGNFIGTMPVRIDSDCQESYLSVHG